MYRAFEDPGRVFVLPVGVTGEGNDLEMVVIRKLLAAHGEEIIDTAQGWGGYVDPQEEVIEFLGAATDGTV